MTAIEKTKPIYKEDNLRYTFYRMPRYLFTEDDFQQVSGLAKLLYMLLLDRTGLSLKNNWVDWQGKVYIRWTIAEIQSKMNCCKQKACDLLAELEHAGLVDKKRQGQGRASLIYVRFFHKTARTQEKKKSVNPEMQESKSLQMLPLESCQIESNQNDLSNTDLNNIHLSYQEKDWKEMKERIKANMDYEVLVFDNPTWQGRLDEVVAILTEAVCCSSDSLKIGKKEIPATIIRERLLSLDMCHIQYVFECMDRNTSAIRNIKGYLLTALYNAPETIESHYQARVRSEIYG